MPDGFVLGFVWFIWLTFLPTLLSEPGPQHWHLPYWIHFSIMNLSLSVPWTLFLLCWPESPFRIHEYAPINFPGGKKSFVNLKSSSQVFFWSFLDLSSTCYYIQSRLTDRLDALFFWCRMLLYGRVWLPVFSCLSLLSCWMGS